MIFRNLIAMGAAVVMGLAGAVLVGASPAEARWLKAESKRFVVYSDGDEKTLRGYVHKLETFDALLRRLHALPAAAEVPRKLPVYLVSGERALRILAPNLPRDAAGFYTATGEDIFAVASRSGREDDFLLHEYVHHFMLQNFPYAYPSWLVEGYAEYYMTTTIDEAKVGFGGFNRGRTDGLQNGRWISFSDLVGKRAGQLPRRDDVHSYYAQAWLLTHWFMSDDSRRRQLDSYVKAVGAGAEPVRAMEAATGKSMDDLEKELKAYFRGGLRWGSMPADSFPREAVEVSELGASADDLLLLSQRLKMGVPDEQRATTVQLVRNGAARHADDPFAMLTLGHAELHFGDRAAGEAVLMRLLEREPANVEALQLMATARLRAAREDGADEKALKGQARSFLARAYKADRTTTTRST